MKVLVSDTSVLIDLDRGTLVEATFSKPRSACHSSSPFLTCFTNASSGSMAGRTSSGWGCALRSWMATGLHLPSAISANGSRCLFRTASPLLSRRRTRGHCYPGIGSCANSQRKRRSDATECCGCSTKCSSTASSTRTTCVPASARLLPIRDAGFPSRKSASGFSPIPFADPFGRSFPVTHGMARLSVGNRLCFENGRTHQTPPPLQSVGNPKQRCGTPRIHHRSDGRVVGTLNELARGIENYR